MKQDENTSEVCAEAQLAQQEASRLRNEADFVRDAGNLTDSPVALRSKYQNPNLALILLGLALCYKLSMNVYLPCNFLMVFWGCCQICLQALAGLSLPFNIGGMLGGTLMRFENMSRWKQMGQTDNIHSNWYIYIYYYYVYNFDSDLHYVVGWMILTDERINMDQVCGNHKIPSVFCVVQLFKTVNHVNAPWKALSSTFAGCLGEDIWVWLKIRGPKIHWLPTHIIKEQPSLCIFSMDS